jgi:hypothetical protein
MGLTDDFRTKKVCPSRNVWYLHRVLTMRCDKLVHSPSTSTAFNRNELDPHIPGTIRN